MRELKHTHSRALKNIVRALLKKTRCICCSYMKNYNINYYYNRGGDKKTKQKYTQNKEKDDENIPILCSAAGGVYL